MLKATNFEEIRAIPEPEIRKYILKKATELMAEYGVNDLNDIGCFVVLEKEETEQFKVNEMEFVEVLEIDSKYYLHGVRLLGDSYGEDIYLPVEVVRK